MAFGAYDIHLCLMSALFPLLHVLDTNSPNVSRCENPVSEGLFHTIQGNFEMERYISRDTYRATQQRNEKFSAFMEGWRGV